MPNNFFKLSAVHPVVTDFITHHNRSAELYKSSYLYLQDLSENLEKFKPDADAANRQFHHQLCEHFTQINTSYTDLIVAYHAFRTLARRNAAVMQEFKKLPADFSPLQKTFRDILDGYLQSIGELKAAL